MLNLLLTKKHKTPQWVLASVRLVALLFFAVLIFNLIENKQSWAETKTYLHDLPNTLSYSTLIAAMVLMPANWTVEALKWRTLVKQLKDFKLSTAIKAVLSGLPLGLLTPNRVGEFAGRILFLPPNKRLKGAFASLVGSVSQFIITVLFGSIAAVYFMWTSSPSLGFWYLLAISLLLIVLNFTLFLVFLNTRASYAILDRFKWLHNRFEKHFRIFLAMDSNLLLKALLWSSLRYVIFFSQFYLLLTLFHVDISLGQALITIPITYLAQTAIPSITLAELGVREASAAGIIGLVSSNITGIVLASFSIWFINLIIPSIAGSLILAIHKFRRN